ncbi:hypothetical protein BH09BAC5_BH09BAC5_17360 [soil metagenome]
MSWLMLHRRKIIRWSIILAVSFPVFCFVGLNLLTWFNCSGHFSANMPSDPQQAFEERTLIAMYKTNGDANARRIAIQRMRFGHPWKYIFYTPMEYSEGFYLNASTGPLNTEFIICENDTVRMNGLHFLPELPSEFKVFLEGKSEPLTYRIDQKFQENIDHIPDVPFFEKLSSGPFLNDD